MENKNNSKKLSQTKHDEGLQSDQVATEYLSKYMSLHLVFLVT